MLSKLIASDSTENEKKHNKYEKDKGYMFSMKEMRSYSKKICNWEPTKNVIIFISHFIFILFIKLIKHNSNFEVEIKVFPGIHFINFSVQYISRRDFQKEKIIASVSYKEKFCCVFFPNGCALMTATILIFSIFLQFILFSYRRKKLFSGFLGHSYILP